MKRKNLDLTEDCITDKAMRSAFFKLRNNLIKSRNDEYRTEL